MPQGIKREAGESPGRSRHCDREPKGISTGGMVNSSGKGLEAMNWSQETCLYLWAAHHGRWELLEMISR